jgi:hypothetical protein
VWNNLLLLGGSNCVHHQLRLDGQLAVGCLKPSGGSKVWAANDVCASSTVLGAWHASSGKLAKAFAAICYDMFMLPCFHSCYCQPDMLILDTRARCSTAARDSMCLLDIWYA